MSKLAQLGPTLKEVALKHKQAWSQHLPGHGWTNPRRRRDDDDEWRTH